MLEALGFDIKLKDDICILEEQPWPDGQPRVTTMTRLPSKHRCISILEFDPDGWDASAEEGEEFDVKFRIPTEQRAVGALKTVLAQDATRKEETVLALDATRHASTVLAQDATRVASTVLAQGATREVLELDTVLAPDETLERLVRDNLFATRSCGPAAHRVVGTKEKPRCACQSEDSECIQSESQPFWFIARKTKPGPLCHS